MYIYLMKKPKTIITTGDRFTNLTVICEVERNKKQRRYKCQCICGNIVLVQATNLISLQTKSCGCYTKTRLRTHGLSDTDIHNVWKGIKQRCLDKNQSAYKNYGGRGISICDLWLNNFVEFYNWCISNGWKKGMHIDRINNNGNYEPSNCRIVSAKHNSRNKRSTFFIDGKCLAEHIENVLPNYNSEQYRKVYHRIKRSGYTLEKALINI